MKTEITEDTIFVQTPKVDNYFTILDQEKITRLRKNGYKKLKGVPPNVSEAYIKDRICVQFFTKEAFDGLVKFMKENDNNLHFDFNNTIKLPI